jgi:hypothetical protein
MRRLAVGLCLVFGLAAVVGTGGFAAATQATSAGPSPSSTQGGVLVRTNTRAALPVHGGTVTSLNWAGYAVTPANPAITSVTSTFIVPSAGLLPPGFAATWVGIGGFSTSDLIQAGVGEQSLPSLPLVGAQYYPWYEMLPNAEVQLTGCAGAAGYPGDANCTVAPGDSMAVIIQQSGNNLWTIAFANTTRHWTWIQQFPYQSSKSSAEWIAEAPTLAVLQTIIAPLSIVSFGPTSIYTQAGTSYTIAQGNPTKVVLSPGFVNEATPSGLAKDGQSFNVCTYAQTCATP